MNVASVTVTAITQGLIVPSGILSLASSLFRMILSLDPSTDVYALRVRQLSNAGATS
jgi:hypothetical protein